MGSPPGAPTAVPDPRGSGGQAGEQAMSVSNPSSAALSPQLNRDPARVSPVRFSGLHLFHQRSSGNCLAQQRQQEEDP